MPEVKFPAHISHPFSPAGQANPYPAYTWLLDNDPIRFEKMSGWWLVVSHSACASALSDHRFSAALGQRERTREDDLPESMLTTDPPAHARLRGPGALLLGPAGLRAQLGELSDEVGGVLDRLAGRDEADITADVGEPFAIAVFARLLALDAAQAPAFADLARRLSVNLDPTAGPAAGAAGREAAAEFSAFMDGHIDKLSAADPDCPLARLAADPRLTRDEMLGIVNLAVIGGFLPLADLPSYAVHWLATPPGRFASLPDQIPDGTVTPGVPGGRPPGPALTGRDGGIIDELMRLATPIPFTARVTTDALELGGVLLPAGARVLLMIAAANRDRSVFAQPDEFDQRRSPNPHLAFGAGPHVCLGAPLVRWAGGALLRGLAARYPGLAEVGNSAWGTQLVPRRLLGQRIALRR